MKFALFAAEEPLPRLWSGAIERIGLANGRFHAVDAEGATVLDETRDIADHDVALRLLLDAIEPPGAFVWLAGSRMRPWERCVELARLAEYWERRALDARRFCSGT